MNCLIAFGAASAGVTDLLSVEALVALLTLTALEVVLGIDNVVFIAILVGKLPPEQQERARRIGLGLAMGIRILLLLTISWIMRLTEPLFSVPAVWTGADGDALGISGRDLILLGGGVFLIGKSTYEIYDNVEGHHSKGRASSKPTHLFGSVLIQILLLDIVFSLDSVITAVGMVKTDPEHMWKGISIMTASVVIAVGVMLLAASRVSAFVDRHPSIKVLALAFLLLIGFMLVVEGLHNHFPKGYIYFAMAFSLAVEMINIRARRRHGT